MAKPINDNRALIARTRSAQRQRVSDSLYECSLSADWLHNKLSEISEGESEKYEEIVLLARSLAIALDAAVTNADKEV